MFSKTISRGVRARFCLCGLYATRRVAQLPAHSEVVAECFVKAAAGSRSLMSLCIGKSQGMASDLRAASHLGQWHAPMRAPMRAYVAARARWQQSAPKRWELFPDELAEEQVHRLVAGCAQVQPVRQVRVPVRLRLQLRPQVQHRHAELHAQLPTRSCVLTCSEAHRVLSAVLRDDSIGVGHSPRVVRCLRSTRTCHLVCALRERCAVVDAVLSLAVDEPIRLVYGRRSDDDSGVGTDAPHVLHYGAHIVEVLVERHMLLFTTVSTRDVSMSVSPIAEQRDQVSKGPASMMFGLATKYQRVLTDQCGVDRRCVGVLRHNITTSQSTCLIRPFSTASLAPKKMVTSAGGRMPSGKTLASRCNAQAVLYPLYPRKTTSACRSAEVSQLCCDAASGSPES